MAFCWNYYWRDGLLLFKPLISAPGILINHEEHYETTVSSVSAQQRHFFIEDTVNGKQASLKTRDKAAAQRIFNAKNESHQQPAINLQIARAYLMVVDPLVASRSWRHAAPG
jgi:hypothetical protein